MGDRVTICEVAPRDGLQNEPVFVATADKVKLIDLLSLTGLKYIEAASFVSPRRVPQMADGSSVLSGIKRRSGVVYAALTPNLRGYEAALAAGTGEVAVFASASESFSERNINCSVAGSLLRYREICRAAARDGVPVRGYISCAIACPYDGPTAPPAVQRLALSLLEMGCREISLGDTIGVATPRQVELLLDVVLAQIPVAAIAGHFHDTRQRALACIGVALKYGVRVFDASVGGAGGCPFAPGAKGNVATEAVVGLLADEGYETGIDMEALRDAAVFIKGLLGRTS
jgi:hydroxymethylglutaryl-CoA lyase